MMEYLFDHIPRSLMEHMVSFGDVTRTTGCLLVFAIGLPVVYYLYQLYLLYRFYCIVGVEVNKLPGPKTQWFFGNILQHPGPCGKAFDWVQEQNSLYGGRVYRWWLGPFRPGVVLTHPDTVKLILRTAEPKVTSGNDAYMMIQPWLGEGLITSTGEKWQRNRKLLTPAFHFDILKPYMKVYNDSVDVLLNKWEKQLVTNQTDSIDICTSVSLLTLDIILRCAFSYNSDVQENDGKNTYVNYVSTLTDMITIRWYKLHWRLDWLYYRTAHGKLFMKKCNYVHQKAEEIISQRKETLKRNTDIIKNKHLDFLDIMLLAKDESGNGLSDTEIRNEVDTFLFAGHDTTSAAISWCLYNFATHPEIQDEAYEEVHRILDNRDSSFVTWDDLGEMSFLLKCVKESIRLHPPVPFVGRELSKPLEVEGVTLLPGTVIDISPWSIHHNPAVWGDDHMEFRPERFDPENMKNMDSHAFIPFSAGPRNCIGQSFAMHEVKTVIARILHSYQLKVDPDHPIEMIPELVLRAKYGIKIHLIPRNI